MINIYLQWIICIIAGFITFLFGIYVFNMSRRTLKELKENEVGSK